MSETGNLSKLRPELVEILPEKGISELNDFQVRVIEALKAGKNILAEAPDGTGKTTALELAILQRIDGPGEGSPRAIVLCADNQKAVEMHAFLQKFARALDLTFDLAHDKGNMLQQRNDIFDGTEVIIGTPKRVYELYIQNGYNIGKLKLFAIDDALTIFKSGHKMHISRLAESLPKCQFLLLSHSFSDRRIEDFLDEFVPVNVLVEEEA